MTEELDIYDIVTSKANGRYFVIDNQVYSHERNMTTKVTYYNIFEKFLSGFIGKINECYSEENYPANEEISGTDGFGISFKAVYDCDHSDDYYVQLQTSNLNDKELLQLAGIFNLFIAAKAANMQQFIGSYYLEHFNRFCGLNIDIATFERNLPEARYKQDPKTYFDRTIESLMTIQFLEAGKEPLSSQQRIDFLKAFESEKVEVHEHYSDPWYNCEAAEYILSGEFKCVSDLKEMIKTQRSCSIGSAEWIDLHRRSMKTLYPDWDGSQIYDLLLKA